MIDMHAKVEGLHLMEVKQSNLRLLSYAIHTLGRGQAFELFAMQKKSFPAKLLQHFFNLPIKPRPVITFQCVKKYQDCNTGLYTHSIIFFTVSIAGIQMCLLSGVVINLSKTTEPTFERECLLLCGGDLSPGCHLHPGRGLGDPAGRGDRGGLLSGGGGSGGAAGGGGGGDGHPLVPCAGPVGDQDGLADHQSGAGGGSRSLVAVRLGRQLLDARPVLGPPVLDAVVGLGLVLLPVNQPGRQLRLLDVACVCLGLGRGAGVVDLQVLECSGAGVVKVGGVHLDDAARFAITSEIQGKGHT